MENKNITHQTADQKGQSSCNVKQTFNFTVGAFAIIAAIIAGYLIYKYLIK